MRGPLATLVTIVVVGLVLGLGAPRVLPGAAPPPAPPPPAPEAVDPAGAAAPADPVATLLRERLGGLAALVLPSGPRVEACADPALDLAAAPAADPVEAVVATTEQLRERTLDEPVEIRLLDAEELVAEVEERFADRADPERVGLEKRVLEALGAIGPGVDLADLRVRAFAEQVSGLHAGGEGLVLVRAGPDGELDPLARVVLAHEVEHAITFQHLGRPTDHRADGETADERRASLAVVEGSATLLMLQYARGVLDDAERDVLRDSLLVRAADDVLADYTPYLLSELRFPYSDGLRFACALWLEGGWPAVEAVYTAPPETTAEILFPERYGEEPETPRRLGNPSPGWERARATTFGAAELLWLLEAPGGDRRAALDRARDRAAAWAGGRLVVWTDEDETAVGIALVERADAHPELCHTVRDWYAAAFPDAAVADADGLLTFSGSEQAAALRCTATEVRIGIAPDAGAAGVIAR